MSRGIGRASHMPFTPFHLGPALALKAVAGRHFSLTVFALSQVMIDVEPLVRMLRGDAILHGFTHTYGGATSIAVVAALLGRPICQRLLALGEPDGPSRIASVEHPTTISLGAAVAAAFIGTYSHVFLDSLMHADLRPLAPFSDANPLLGRVGVRDLHVACIVSGFVGIAILWISSIRRSRK